MHPLCFKSIPEGYEKKEIFKKEPYKGKNQLKDVTGDILSPANKDRITIICHQVNCKGVMGAGLAKQIRSRYPEVYNKYRWLCEKTLVSHNLLGHCQPIEVGANLFVANLFGQYNYGTDKRYTDYQALSNSLNQLALAFQDAATPVVIRIPYKMGCGLAGGEWPTVLNIIRTELVDNGYEVEIWKL